MNEDLWLSSNNPPELLRHMMGNTSERKLRLLACAACRRLWFLLTAPQSQEAVLVSERYADGHATLAELRAAAVKADVAIAM